MYNHRKYIQHYPTPGITIDWLTVIAINVEYIGTIIYTEHQKIVTTKDSFEFLSSEWQKAIQVCARLFDKHFEQ